MPSLEKAFMSADSSSTQLCPQQLDDILGPDLTQFEILIHQLISEDEDQVSRSKALFYLVLSYRDDLTQFETLIHWLISEYEDKASRSRAFFDLALRSRPYPTHFETLIQQFISKDEDKVSRSKALFDLALRSRPDSLLLALSELLSPGLPLVRAEAAKQIGEILTTFSSNFRKTTLDTLKLDLLSAYRNEVLDSDVRKHLLRTISDFHATGSWHELLPNLFECVNSQSPCFQEHELLVFKSLAENSNGNAALIRYLETFKKIFSECLGNCSSWDVKIVALDTSISFVQFIPYREDPIRFDYLLRLMMLTLTEALNSGSEYETQCSLNLLIKLAKTEPMFFERQLEKVLWLMLKITVDDSLEEDIKHSALEFLMALVEKAPSMIRKEQQFIKRLFDELIYMLFDIEGVDAAAAANAAAANHTVAVAAKSVAGVAAKAARAAKAAVAAAARAPVAAAARAPVAAAANDDASDADDDADVDADDADFGACVATHSTDFAARARHFAARARHFADRVAVFAAAAAEEVVAAADDDDEVAAADVADVAAVAAAATAAATAASTAASTASTAANATARRAARHAIASADAYAACATDAADSYGVEVRNFWKSSNYILGKECLPKLSIFLGEKMIFQWVLRLFSRLLGTSKWQRRHAVLIAISKIAKGCNKVMLDNLDEIVQGVLKSLNHLHPYVRLAAINAIRELSVVCGPKLQTEYHEIFFIRLDKAMKDSLRHKLQVTAFSAALSFLTSGPKEILHLYNRRIIDEFRELVEEGIFIDDKFLRSELVKVVTILSRYTNGPWAGESLEEYLALIKWLDSSNFNLGKSEVHEIKRLRDVIYLKGYENSIKH